jgi:hypothetical protein
MQLWLLDESYNFKLDQIYKLLTLKFWYETILYMINL